MLLHLNLLLKICVDYIKKTKANHSSQTSLLKTYFEKHLADNFYKSSNIRFKEVTGEIFKVGKEDEYDEDEYDEDEYEYEEVEESLTEIITKTGLIIKKNNHYLTAYNDENHIVKVCKMKLKFPEVLHIECKYLFKVIQNEFEEPNYKLARVVNVTFESVLSESFKRKVNLVEPNTLRTNLIAFY